MFLSRHDPAVIVYDVSIPYDKNWTFLRLLLDSESMHGRKVVLTTTNKNRLEEARRAHECVRDRRASRTIWR